LRGWETFLYHFKAGPAGGLRSPSGPAAMPRSRARASPTVEQGAVTARSRPRRSRWSSSADNKAGPVGVEVDQAGRVQDSLEDGADSLLRCHVGNRRPEDQRCDPRAYRAFMLIAFAIVVALWFKIPTVRSASVVSILVAGIILALSVASILPLPRYIVRKSTNSLALKS
jgi:hypothetical protein